MKNQQALKGIVFFAAISMLFASCGTDKMENFSARKYTHFKKGEATVFVNPPTQKNNFSATENNVSKNNFSNDVKPNNTISVVPNKIEKTNATSITKSSKKAAVFISEKGAVNAIIPASSNIETTHSAVKSAVIHAAATVQKLDQTDKIVQIICAIIIPPLGVYLHENNTINKKFWIDLILTLIFDFPGIIYALLVVTDSI